MEVGGQRHAPAALPPATSRCPLYKRLGGRGAGLDGCGKSCPPPTPGFDPQTVQPVTIRDRTTNGSHFLNITNHTAAYNTGVLNTTNRGAPERSPVACP